MTEPSTSRRPRARSLASDEAHEEEQQALVDVNAAFRWLAATEDALGDAAAREIHRRRAAVDAAAARSHYTLAVLGRDVEARTRLLNDLLGETLLDPQREDAAGCAVRFRRGVSVGYRARFSDGTAEDFDTLVPDRGEQLRAEVARRRGRFEETEGSIAAIRRRLDEDVRALEATRDHVASAEAELEDLRQRRAAAARAAQRATSERATALATAQRRWTAVPGFLRARPPWWAFWAWLARILLGRRYRHALADAGTLSQRAILLHSHQDAAEEKERRVRDEMRACEGRLDLLRAACSEEARRCATVEKEEQAHRARVLESRRELEGAEAALAAFVDDRRSRFRERVADLTNGRARAVELESLQVELDSLPAEVEIADVGGADHALDLQRVWELVDREADGCAVAGDVPRTAQLLFGGAIRSATPDLLAARLRRARVLRATRHAAEACKAARQSLEAAGVRAAETTRRRAEALHKEFEAGTRRLENELVRVQSNVKSRAAAALSQAGNHIEAEIDRLRGKWLDEVRRAQTLAALRSTLASIESEAEQAIPAAAAAARGLVVSTLSGIAAELVQALADQPESPVVVPATWSELEFSPFPADLRRAIRVAPSRFGSHLQALATTRTACEDALNRRVERLRRRAVANLLHLEPQTAQHLERALEETVIALQQARTRRYQRTLDDVRADADASAQAGCDELREEIDAFASRLRQHERKLAEGL